MIRGVAVMRRRADGFLNATQILKVAGIDKSKRTKILERDVIQGHHEKVQGGYGRYQGTWVPYERGKELAAQYGVTHLLAPIFDFDPSTTPISAGRKARSPTKAHSAMPMPPSNAIHLNGYNSFLGSAYGGGSNHASANNPQPPPQPIFVTPSGMNEPSVQPLPLTSKLASSAPITSSASTSISAVPTTQTAPSAKRPRRDSQGNIDLPDNVSSGPMLKRSRSHSPLKPVVRSFPLRNSVRALEPTLSVNFPRHQSILLSMLQDANATVPELVSNLIPSPADSDFEVDMIIDEQGHAALHWAASLGRVNITKLLIARGADVNRGNFTGETPLSRAVLVTNNFDEQSFLSILEVLAPSMRTLDSSGRSIFHHIALIAGVKGRSASARYYLESCLEWIAKHQQGEFRSLVDVQDMNGDTALNIAARVGNRSLVRLLLDVGANKTLANKLNLRPGDFGVEGEHLQRSTAEEITNALRSPQSAPVQKSKDVILALTQMIENLSSSFAAEMQSKQEPIDKTQLELRALSLELSECRREMIEWQGKVFELEETQQRIRNLERAILEEDNFDWTGRTNVDGTAQSESSAFLKRGPASILSSEHRSPSSDLPPDPEIPVHDSMESLIELRRMATWSDRTQLLLEKRIEAIQGESAEKEVKCRRIVSLCTGVEPERVEKMLPQLLIAVESDGPGGIDLSRVSAFLNKVKTNIV